MTRLGRPDQVGSCSVSKKGYTGLQRPLSHKKALLYTAIDNTKLFASSRLFSHLRFDAHLRTQLPQHLLLSQLSKADGLERRITVHRSEMDDASRGRGGRLAV